MATYRDFGYASQAEFQQKTGYKTIEEYRKAKRQESLKKRLEAEYKKRGVLQVTKEFGAEKAKVTYTDPKTGEVIARGTQPRYRPAHPLADYGVKRPLTPEPLGTTETQVTRFTPAAQREGLADVATAGATGVALGTLSRKVPGTGAPMSALFLPGAVGAGFVLAAEAIGGEGTVAKAILAEEERAKRIGYRSPSAEFMKYSLGQAEAIKQFPLSTAVGIVGFGLGRKFVKPPRQVELLDPKRDPLGTRMKELEADLKKGVPIKKTGVPSSRVSTFIQERTIKAKAPTKRFDTKAWRKGQIDPFALTRTIQKTRTTITHVGKEGLLELRKHQKSLVVPPILTPQVTEVQRRVAQRTITTPKEVERLLFKDLEKQQQRAIELEKVIDLERLSTGLVTKTLLQQKVLERTLEKTVGIGKPLTITEAPQIRFPFRLPEPSLPGIRRKATRRKPGRLASKYRPSIRGIISPIRIKRPKPIQTGLEIRYIAEKGYKPVKKKGKKKKKPRGPIPTGLGIFSPKKRGERKRIKRLRF